jgi:hypothetical protein
VEEMRNAFRILVGEAGIRWEDNREIEWEGVDSI